MALIYCRYCGHQISDRALRCPHCGKENLPLPDPSQPVQPAEEPEYDEPEYSNDNNNKGKTGLIIGLVVTLLAVTGVGYYFYDQHNKNLARQEAEKAAAELLRQDSIAAAQAETARQEAARQDSLRLVNMVTPDLALSDLHGDVKTLSPAPFEGVEHNKQFKFTTDGSLIYSTANNEKIKRNANGYVTEWTVDESEDFTRGVTFIWQGDKLTGFKNWGWEWGWTTTYTRDSNGYVIKETEIGGSEAGEQNTSIVYQDYIVDEVGNWIERKYRSTYTNVCIMHDTYDPNCEEGGCEKGTNSGVEKRTITYYTKREHKRYTLEEYLALPK